MDPWPVKSREIISHHFDSRLWNDFVFRQGDIVIATYAKAGTTWVQQIVGQLVFGAPEELNVNKLSTWYDFRHTPPDVRNNIAQQTHRRFLKTHLPADALVISPVARYIYIARDGRDTAWSYHHHHFNHTDEFLAILNTDLPAGLLKIERGTDDPRAFFETWLERDGYPIWPFWSHVRSWWELRDLPNVLLLHFNDLKSDLPGSVQRIASFLDITVPENMRTRILEHCSFDYMKRHAANVAPRGGIAWKGGAETFFNKGTNGRWRDALSADQIADYEARALSELGPACAAWLASGGQIS